MEYEDTKNLPDGFSVVIDPYAPYPGTLVLRFRGVDVARIREGFVGQNQGFTSLVPEGADDLRAIWDEKSRLDEIDHEESSKKFYAEIDRKRAEAVQAARRALGEWKKEIDQ